MAAKRIRLGFIFGVDNQWIAGSYYLLNIVHALNSLPDADKPHLVFLTDEKSHKLLHNTNYPYYSFKNPYRTKRSIHEAFVNKILKAVKGKDVILKKVNKKHIDALFPASFDAAYELAPNKLFWIPDFQHHYFPKFFTAEELELRDTLFNQIARMAEATLVLSSHDALKDFNLFYPKVAVKTHVLPFAVTLPDLSHLVWDDIRAKYRIEKPYYIVCNQFWQHKNHITVLKALAYLRNKLVSVPFDVFFTGKPEDYRAPGFYRELSDFVDKNQLTDISRFVGFIDRAEQLMLMKNAISIVQPSLFEGWSTVVEDAKALNQYIILSDISVHREQTNKNVRFFEAENHLQLAGILIEIAQNMPSVEYFDYRVNIRSFGKNFCSILQNGIANNK